MSSNPESSKTLAAVGALLMFLNVVPGLGIIGIILLIIGIKGLSEYYRDDGMYRDALRGLIFGIIGSIAVSVFFVLAIWGGLFSTFAFGLAGAVAGVIGIIVVVIIAFIFYLLMAMNFRRSLDALAQRSGENNFHTAGTLLWWGAILSIVVVGFFLVWIAFLIAAIAFFSMRLGPAQPYQQPKYDYIPPPPPTTSSTQGTLYCPNCGAPVQQGTLFCPNCGKQLSSP